jgi:hypothetical protein
MASKELDFLEEIVERPMADPEAIAEPDQNLLEQSVEYLQSDEARIAMEQNAYWPKWDGPWWQMLVLHELGLTKLIPQERIQQVLDAFETYYLHHFPYRLDEIPDGIDPLNQVICHCQMGCTDQLLTAYGINICERFPWVAKWYEQYQLADGGFNCDEVVYTRENPKSSVISTVPVLEAVLNRSLSVPSENANFPILKQGADYLIKRKLFRSASTGDIIDPTWTDLCFPRFYFYDILRGLSFLLQCCLKQQNAIPANAILESAKIIHSQNPSGYIAVKRVCWKDSMTRAWDAEKTTWIRRSEGSYPLLDSLSKIGNQSKPLTQEWNNTKTTLKILLKNNLVLES